MSKMRLRRVGPMSVGIVFGVLYGILGLMIGIPMSAIAMLGAAGAKDPASGAATVFMGAFAGLIIPIFYGGLAFVMGCIMAFFYNVAASLTGGVEVTIE